MKIAAIAALMFWAVGSTLAGCAIMLRNDQLEEEILLVPYSCPDAEYVTSTLVLYNEATQELDEWTRMPGNWVVTHYGDESDGFIQQKTGAAWNGLECEDHTHPPHSMPEVVTKLHHGGAMPGAEFYCMPVKVCVGDKCSEFTAVDVPEHDRLWLDDEFYSHVDVWQKVAEELDIVAAGIITDGVKVYVK